MNRHPRRDEIDVKRASRKALAERNLKRCSRCKAVRPFEEFYADPRHIDGLQSHCAACFSYTGRTNYLDKAYGLTREDVLVLIRAQRGLCPICGRTLEGRKIVIDHSHVTHVIRGALHDYCNSRILPLIEWRSEDVGRALMYLNEAPAVVLWGLREVPETNQTRRKKKRRGCGG